MADFLDLSKTPELPLPWNCYADAAKGVLAYPLNGAAPPIADAGHPWPDYVALGPWGSPGRVYQFTNVLGDDGRVQMYTMDHGDVLYNDDDLYTPDKWIVSREGGYGEALISPYITWLPHPTLDKDGNAIPGAPFAVGVSVDGEIYAEYLLPQPNVIRLGAVALAKGDGSLDLAFNPLNRAIFYVAVDNRDGTGRIIQVDRTAAIADRKANAKPVEDANLWAQTDLWIGAGITSLVCCDDGTLYACENSDSDIVEIKTNSVRYIPLPFEPFWVRRTSDERLLVADQHEGLYCYSRDGNPLQTIRPQQEGTSAFVFLDCDRAGVWMERDMIFFASSHMFDADSGLFFYGPNWSKSSQWAGMWIGEGARTTGRARFIGSPIHYAWSGFFHVDQGALELQGFGNANPTVLCPRRPNDPQPAESWDATLAGFGRAVLMAGTVAGMEFSKPSLTCQIDATGWSGFGVGADYLYGMKKVDGSQDWQAMVDWIHAGGIGSFRRDEIVGYDLYALLYHLAGASQELIRRGQPLLDELRAFIGDAANHPTTMPGTAFDFFQFVETNGHISAYVEARAVKMRCVTGNGSAVSLDESLVIRCVMNEGMPTAQELGNFSSANGWTLPAPTLPAGQHALSCHVTAGPATYLGEASAVYQLS